MPFDIDRPHRPRSNQPFITTITMASKPSTPLIWRVTLLLTIFIGSTSFSFPTQQIISPSLKVPCFRQKLLPHRCVNDIRSPLYSLPVACIDTDSEEVKKSKKYMKANGNKNLPLLQSISVVVAGRRLSFLILSILLVNFVRSKILKVRCLRPLMEDPSPNVS